MVNSGSRRSEESAESAKTALEEAGFEIEPYLPCQPDHLSQVLAELCESELPLVFVGGGDGTLSLAAGEFAHSQSVVGFVPLGTGNQLAKELGIPTDLAKTAVELAEGKVVSLDLARVNGRPLVTVATVGLSTEIARNLVLKQQIGKLSYVPAAIKAAIETEPFLYTLKTDDGTTTGTAIQIVIGNGRSHAGPFWTAPDASLSDGLLTCYTVGPMNGKEGAVAAGLALVGMQDRTEGISRFRGSSFELSTQPPLPVIIDGEEAWFDTIQASIEPGALQVLVPKAYVVPADRLIRGQLSG